jgi:type I restriction enzyme S subunit
MFAAGTIPFFRTSDVGRVRFGNLDTAADLLNERGASGLRRFPAGTILFPKSGASTFLNHRVMMTKEGCVSSHLAAIRAQPERVEPGFLLYFLATVRAQDMVQDHAYPSLNLPLIAAINVPTPPLPEQRRIVAILDEAFEGIATAKAHAERNLRNAREVFAQSREDILERSEGWLEASLSELSEIRHGYAFEGEHFAAHGEHVLLTPGSFFETGGFRDRGGKTKYFVGAIPPAFVLDEGDLLVAMTEQAAGLLGSPLLVPEDGRYLHNQRLGRVIGRDSVRWTNDFFFHVFNLRRVRAEIHASASGVKVRHTSPAKIGAVRVKFPPTSGEQSAVAAALRELAEDCHRLQALYTRKLAVLDELKQSLLHQAFSGQL